jgi:hypothetical protein
VISDLERALPGLAGHRRTTALAVAWPVIEEALQVSLPEDYKEIIEFYPRFEMCDFFAIAGPRPGAEAVYAAAMITDLEDLREDFGDGVPHQPLADGSGLVPWGTSTSGDTYYWKFEHSKATAVVTGSRDDAFWEFPGTLTQFLAAWLDGTIQPLGQPTIDNLGGPRIALF